MLFDPVNVTYRPSGKWTVVKWTVARETCARPSGNEKWTVVLETCPGPGGNEKWTVARETCPKLYRAFSDCLCGDSSMQTSGDLPWETSIWLVACSSAALRYTSGH